MAWRNAHVVDGSSKRISSRNILASIGLMLLPLLTLISIAIAQTPTLPLQIFGSVTASGAPVASGNTVIVTADGRVIARGLTADGKYGHDPLYLIPAKSESKPGGTEGQPITIYVNGFSTATPSYKGGTTLQTDLATTSPVCGAGGCQQGENCLHCAAECACTDYNIASDPLKEAFIQGAVQGITSPSVLVSAQAGGRHIIKIQKEGAKTVVELTRDLKQNPLDLGQLTIREGSRGTYKSLSAAGLEGPKTLYLDKSGTTTTICAKDQADAAAESITETCTGAGEVKVACNGQAVQGITCEDKQTQFAVSGLTHSTVIETSSAAIDAAGGALPPAPGGIGLTSAQGSDGAGATPAPQVQQPPQLASPPPQAPTPGQPVNIENYDATKYREEYRKAWQESRKGKEPAPPPPAAPKTCTEDWICNQWSDCNPSGTQVRGCTDKNKCGTSKGQPPTSQACTPPATTAPAGQTLITPPPAASPQPIATPLVSPPAAPAPVTRPVQTAPAIQRPAPAPAAPPGTSSAEGSSKTLWVWLIGILVVVILASSLEIWHLLGQQKKLSEAEKQQLLSSVPYIRQYQRQGYTEFDIRKMFKSQGWDDQQLDKLFTLAQEQTTTQSSLNQSSFPSPTRPELRT